MSIASGLLSGKLFYTLGKRPPGKTIGRVIKEMGVTPYV